MFGGGDVVFTIVGSGGMTCSRCGLRVGIFYIFFTKCVFSLKNDEFWHQIMGGIFFPSSS